MSCLIYCILVKVCDVFICISLFVFELFCLVVNILVGELVDENLFKFLCRVLIEFDLIVDCFEIELIEIVLIDVDINILVSLKEVGFILVLDDFGIGYFLLFYLNWLFIDILKIDCSFILNIFLDGLSSNFI